MLAAIKLLFDELLLTYLLVLHYVGKVVSTETTYKYHMQIQENSVDAGAKARDVPLKTLLKPVKPKLSDSGEVPFHVEPNVEECLQQPVDENKSNLAQ